MLFCDIWEVNDTGLIWDLDSGLDSKCRDRQIGCFNFGQYGHFFKECQKNIQGKGIGGGTKCLYIVACHHEQ